MGKKDLFGAKKNETEQGEIPAKAAEATPTANAEEDVRPEEEVKVNTQADKKTYLYIALRENGEVILDKKGEPFFSSVEDGSTPKWDDKIKEYSKESKVIINKKLRAEIEKIPDGVRGKERKKVKKQQREGAKEELMQIAVKEIAEAREKAAVEQKLEKATAKAYATEEKKQTEDVPVDTKTEKVLAADDNTQIPENITPKKTEENKLDSTAAAPDTSVILQAVKNVGMQMNQDLNEVADDVLATIADNDQNLLAGVKAAVEKRGENSDTRIKKYFEQVINVTGQKTQKASEDLARKMNEAGRTISDAQDKLVSKMTTVGKRMSELGESVESIEGDLRKLDQLDEIAELLRNKGLNLSMEIPPVNAEEEDIINLVRYSQKITEQLGYAARDLIRKQEAFKSQAESNENEQRMMAQKLEASYKSGIVEGKKQVVKQLLAKYEDVDAIKESDENYVHVIWTLLMELGVVIDGDGHYEKGREIELSAEDIGKMMATYSKLEVPGLYRVVRTGLSLRGEIISAAQFEKIAPNVVEEKSEGKTETAVPMPSMEDAPKLKPEAAMKEQADESKQTTV